MFVHKTEQLTLLALNAGFEAIDTANQRKHYYEEGVGKAIATFMEETNTKNSAEYEGHCAFAVSTGKLDVLGGNHSSSINGKKYLFSNPVAKILFKLLPNRIKKADTNWNNKTNG